MSIMRHLFGNNIADYYQTKNELIRERDKKMAPIGEIIMPIFNQYMDNSSTCAEDADGRDHAFAMAKVNLAEENAVFRENYAAGGRIYYAYQRKLYKLMDEKLPENGNFIQQVFRLYELNS